MTEHISYVGYIRRFLFQNDDRSFCVAKFLVRDQGRDFDYDSSGKPPTGEIAVVGDFANANVGEKVEIWGKWTTHAKYGERFSLNTILPLDDAGRDGAVAFLASGEVYGVSDVLAERIGDHFGDELPEILEKHPERVAEVAGIGEKRAFEVSAQWTAKADLRRVFMFFAEYGVAGRVARLAFHTFGPNIINLVKQDPFVLLQVRGIGFISAEAIARAMDFEAWDVPYMRGALAHLCDVVVTQDGHTAVLRDLAGTETINLVKKTLENAGHDAPCPSNIGRVIDVAIDDLLARGTVRLLTTGDGEVLIHPRYLTAEQGVGLLYAQPSASDWDKLTVTDPKDAVAAAVADTELELTEEQTDAILYALTHPRSLVTGGPGTGKTTVLNTVVMAAERMGMSYALCAPTGKAAKRMSEVTGCEAMTIHRMLAFSPKNGGFQIGALAARSGASPNEWPRLSADLLIIDESSMLDAELAFAITSAARDGAHVMLVGDFDQLPSVGPGNVLGDLIDSALVPTTWLTKVFRQGEGSGVVAAAHAIVQGVYPISVTDFEIVPLPEMGDIVDRYLELPWELECEIGDIQALIPTYRGDYGITAFNAEVQRRMTAANQQVRGGRFPLYVGDRVIQLKNDYFLDVVNGDVGYIRDVDKECVYIEFDGLGFVNYPKGSMDNLRPAYAISVHKSQGSEFRASVVVLHRSNWKLLQRNVLYTAVTRAKQKCVLFSSTASLKKAIMTNDQQHRLTTLPYWLAQVEQEPLA